MPIGASIWGPIAVSAIGGAIANSSSSSESPTLSPTAQSLQDYITQLLQQRLKNGSLPPGFQTQGINAINAGYAGASTNENAALTARGLATSPVAGAVTTKLNAARGSDIGTFNASLPLIQRQLQLQDIQAAQGILNPQRGQTGTVSTGGGAAGAATNLAGYLGYLKGRGQNPFGTTPPDPSGSFTSVATGNLGY